MTWLCFALFALATPARAFQTNVGGEGAQFLEIGAGARSLGMGEAYGPIAEGPEAVYWNPAGLAQARGAEVSYTRSELYGIIHHDYLGYAQPVAALGGTLGFSYIRLAQDKLAAVTNTNQQVGVFNPHSDAFLLGYARAFDLESSVHEDRDYFGEKWDVPGSYHPFAKEASPWAGRLMLGAALEGVSEHLYDHSANAVAVNGGALFHPMRLPQLTLSFAFRHAFAQEKFDQENQKLPVEVDLGAAYDWSTWDSRLLPAVEISVPYFGLPHLKTGIEYSRPLGDKMTGSVRAGYNTLSVSDEGALSGFSIGLGLRWQKLVFDFGFEPMATLGQSLRFTAGYKW